MKIAVVQSNPQHKDIEYNLREMLATIERVDAELIVFPELALTGYLFKTREEALPYSLPIGCAEVNSIAAKCKETGKSIVFGHLERSEERLYNSAVVIDREGRVAGVYRKVHLFHFERSVFAPGDTGFKVFGIETSKGPVKLGVMICYDWRFPESARSLAIQGSEIIAVPSNIVTKTGMLHTVLQARAFENKLIVAFADRVGSEEDLVYRGESCIVNYNGELLEKLDNQSENIATVEVDIVATRNKAFSDLNDIFTDRRPDMYR